jgi:hypothetical protein
MNTRPLNNVQSFLSGNRVSVILIVLAVLGRVIQLLFFYSIRFDGSYQVIAMQNFLQGYGFSIHEVFSNNLAETIYRPLTNWPPGYSLLLAPFYLVSGGNYIIAGILMDLCFAFLLIIVSRRILKLFDTPIYIVNLSTLVSGFFIYYFYLITSSDAIAISIFLVGLYNCLAFIKSKDRPGFRAFMIVLTLFIAGSVKYLFIPLIFIVPLYLILIGSLNREKQIKRMGLLVLLCLAILSGALLAWQKFTGGEAAHISQPGTGFFPEHILKMYPFIPASFLQPETAALILPQKLLEVFHRVYQLVHISLIILLFFFSIKHVQKAKYTTDGKWHFWTLTSLISVGTLLLLAGLSLFVPQEEILPGWFWTYIEEPRYYGLPMILLQLSYFLFISKGWYHKRNTQKLLLLIPALLLTVEVVRGMAFSARRLFLWNKEEYSWQYELRFQQYADSLLAVAPGVQKTVTGSSHYMNNRISVYSRIPVLNDNKKINQPDSLHAKSRTLLLVVIHEKDFPNFRPFLEGRSPSGFFEDYFFYTVYVEPD